MPTSLVYSDREVEASVNNACPSTRVVVKQCACCRRDYTLEEWNALSFLGAMDDDDCGWLELRDCGCHSTVALPFFIARRIQ